MGSGDCASTPDRPCKYVPARMYELDRSKFEYRDVIHPESVTLGRLVAIERLARCSLDGCRGDSLVDR
jgi:hypothetical protein